RDLDANTNSSAFNFNTSPRTILAIPIQPVMVIAIIKVHNPAGIITINKITTSKYGTPDKISAIRIIYSSTLQPKYLDIFHNITPIIKSKKAAVNPINKEILAPYHVRAKISRPKLSVPNQCSAEGGLFAFNKSLL